jgi:hypothetical protein
MTFFADQGAEVIKVECPPFGEIMRLVAVFERIFFPLFSILNRGARTGRPEEAAAEAGHLKEYELKSFFVFASNIFHVITMTRSTWLLPLMREGRTSSATKKAHVFVLKNN